MELGKALYEGIGDDESYHVITLRDSVMGNVVVLADENTKRPVLIVDYKMLMEIQRDTARLTGVEDITREMLVEHNR